MNNRGLLVYVLVGILFVNLTRYVETLNFQPHYLTTLENFNFIPLKKVVR